MGVVWRLRYTAVWVSGACDSYSKMQILQEEEAVVALGGVEWGGGD